MNEVNIIIATITNLENAVVKKAVDDALPQIADACDAVDFALKAGGRVFYIGSGTSGRLGVCDAAECPPTFGVPYDLFNGIIAGGKNCMFKAAENEHRHAKECWNNAAFASETVDGNIHQNTLQEIFDGERAQAIYTGFTHRKAVEPLCQTCGYMKMYDKNK